MREGAAHEGTVKRGPLVHSFCAITKVGYLAVRGEVKPVVTRVARFHQLVVADAVDWHAEPGRNSLEAERFNSVMTRLAIALLALAYLTPLAAPVVCLHHGSDDRPACASPDSVGQESALDAPDPCDACGMPDCGDMITCTATSTAVVQRSESPLIPSTGRSTDQKSAAVTNGPPPAPALPPPRA